MEELISILLSNAELQTLTGGNMAPFGQLRPQKGLTYSFNSVSDNGVKSTDRLTLTSVGYTIDESLNILNKAKSLLITVGDDKLTDNVLKVKQNGGGNITNVVDGKTMYHFTAILDVTRRTN